jgi:hypothetical protein
MRTGRTASSKSTSHFAVRGRGVFVGGYFYDPHFGPYPWRGKCGNFRTMGGDLPAMFGMF